ncbi:type 1 glutamine amidotransferase [Chitinimonas sp. JJ19]|uniref:type 1 glutamine amidotransferase n=1 Tax=Chitinimonas sp. JJ19 TaxID=3109352 RepID=UPI003001DBAF
MLPIAIIQHVPDDGPCYFATYLERAGLPYQVFRLFDGHALPARIDAHSGLCILGGPMSANDDLPYLPPLFELVRAAVQADIPVIGHCLGGQIMARALGGTVQASEHVEIGWSELETLDDAAAEWFGGAASLRLFQWHGESFSMPPGARHLVRGRYCANQAFSLGSKHLAMQFHCEVDEAKVRRWLVLGQHELASCTSPAAQQAEQILPNLAQAIVPSQQLADAIYGRWVKGLVG